jgi:hypothetical protein
VKRWVAVKDHATGLVEMIEQEVTIVNLPLR